MKKEYMDLMPEWTKEENVRKFDSMITDDLDSLFGQAVMNKKFGTQVSTYYSFLGLHYNDNSVFKNTFAIDCATAGMKTFDNHTTKLSKNDTYNVQSANLNLIDDVSKDNYCMKYNGSSALLILTMYDILDFSTLNEEQLAFIACIDSYYLGAYNNYGGVSQKAFQHYLDVMEIRKYYEPLFNAHSESDFKDYIEEHKLKRKLRIDDKGKLQTDLDLKYISNLFPMLDFYSVFEKEFTHSYELQYNVKKFAYPTYGMTREKLTDEQIFSLALTRKNEVKYTTKKVGNH